MTDIYRILDMIGRSDDRCVLATITHVEGSAYRKEGATMLIMEGGLRIGMLSGGCLERDIVHRAEELLRAETSHTYVYDMRHEDDLTWGLGTGCNGLVHVLLEPIHRRMRHLIRKLKLCLDQGIPVTGFKRLDEARTATDNWFIPERELPPFGYWKGELPELQYFSEGEGSRLRPMNQNSLVVQTYLPQPRLILFGAGEDAKPLAALAARVGFSITVADWRPAYCNKSHFPDADTLLIGSPDEIQQQLHICNNDFAVVMSHNFERDKQVIRILLRYPIKYIGVLGPRHRTVRLLDGSEVPDNVHSPVGLSIGAEGPEEIAISIMGDLIRVKRSIVVQKAILT